jgi:hypothetical protein
MVLPWTDRAERGAWEPACRADGYRQIIDLVEPL